MDKTYCVEVRSSNPDQPTTTVTVTAPNKGGARKAVGGKVISVTEVVTVGYLRALPYKARRKVFNTLTDAQIEALTEPCAGEAHSNAYVDFCGCCGNGTPWGRMLKAH